MQSLLYPSVGFVEYVIRWTRCYFTLSMRGKTPLSLINPETLDFSLLHANVDAHFFTPCRSFRKVVISDQ